MAKQGQSQSTDPSPSTASQDTNDTKLLLSEISRLVQKQHKEPAIQKAYTDCFLLLAKHYSNDQEGVKALTLIVKEMLQKFLGGRIMAGSGLN